ncbi:MULTISPECIES: tetratricopeptide repeat family protein [Sphingomonas]|uniref:Tetratricopeptide repeat protein n=1 Tax=Sphingomonas kyungheensis TaxID=1069987 RepID=A0ABU8H2Z7_9SPHN|nr:MULTISPECIES: tetratricopeptide repeat family protein [unclassified Sphingomonas]EZP49014.1 Tetratricopeptide repeat family protein [Sphingomonas sp. RIT328]
MKTLSKLALAAVLATGVSGLAFVAPAIAKKEEPATPGFKLSKPVQAIAFQAQEAVKSRNVATAEPLVAQVEAAATTDDDKYIAAALRYDLENTKLVIAQEANPKAPLDETGLAKPLDALIAAKNTPAADRGKYLFRRGQLAYNSNQYPVATQYFTQAKAAGYNSPDFDLQLAKVKVQAGDTAGGLADLDRYITAQKAAGQTVPEAYYRFGIATANNKKMAPETLAWMQKYVAAYPNAKVWRDVILQFAFAQNSLAAPDKSQTVDLYRLLRATGSMPDQAMYEDYAKNVYDKGNPYEAAAVLKEGMAAGKIPATSAFSKSLLTASNTAIKADGSLAGSEKTALASKDGKIAASTADAYLGQNNYAKAIELYRAALSKGGVDANEVNTRLGIALAKSGDKAGAQAAFGAVTGNPRAGIAALWNTYTQVGATPAPAA